MNVIKRDGSVVQYDRSKIVIALSKANDAVEEHEKATHQQIDAIADYISNKQKTRILVEDIQDMVEFKLMEIGKFALAKAYIIYRYNRAMVRKANTTDDSILSLIKNSNKDVMEENSNKDAVMAATQRDLIAGEVSKDLTRRLLLPEYISKAHDVHEISCSFTLRYSTLSYLREIVPSPLLLATLNRKHQHGQHRKPRRLRA